MAAEGSEKRRATDEGRVLISYATHEFLERVGCLDSAPTDAVALIKVTYKVKPSLSQLHVDETRFITLDPSEPPNIGFKAYVNDHVGIAICTQDGKVNDMMQPIITAHVLIAEGMSCT